MSPSAHARVISVNLARVRPNPFKTTSITGIDKRPTLGRVHVRAPGTKADGLGSGLEGDTIGDRAHHGGDDQAVYAYAREDLDHWEGVLGRALRSGSFGENLTTAGIDVNDAGKVREGVVVYGAFGVGNFKTKLHKACVARLFTRNDLVLDAETIADVARELIAKK